MSSEWLKVMLEEIARKKAEAEEALREDQRRLREEVPPAVEPPSQSSGLC